jgi:predicted membrane protein
MARIILGAFLVLFGLGLFAEQFPFLAIIGLNFNTITSLFWVLVGVLLLIKRHSFWGTVFVLIGLLGFLSGFINISTFSLFFPVLIIAFGISILFRRSDNPMRNVGNTVTGQNDAETINETVVFGALEKRYTAKKFRGGKIDTVFAGMKVDLREVEIAPEGANLEINAIFGGGEVVVSPKVKVISNGTAVMGGWANEFDSAGGAGHVLTISGAAVFGAIEVKN